MKVPFNDLYKHHAPILEDIKDAFEEVVKRSSFIRGQDVDRFEKNFAELVGVKNCVSCANGTDALYIAIKALGLTSEDEVIVPAHSWISTSETVTQAGGRVVFCDTLEDTFTMDPKHLARLITPRTAGIIPVHLYGQPAEIETIMMTAKAHDLWVIEDCAQAHLAEYRGRQIGTFGDAATFSFYPGKNLGAMGDAGAIVTNSKKLSDHMASFARHGGLIKGTHVMEGINSRMDGLQAAILNVKLPHLKEWTLNRKKVAKRYTELLKNIPKLTLPFEQPNTSHVWHLYVIQHPERDRLAAFLKENGVQTVINYPICLPLLPAYKRLNHSEEDFPVSFGHQSKILSLPIFPEMTFQQIEYVSDLIKAFCTSAE